MRAIKAETFTGYGGLRQVELPKPQAGKDRVLVHVTARPFGLRPRHATGALCGNDRLLEIGGVPGGHCARHGVAILRYAEHAERSRAMIGKIAVEIGPAPVPRRIEAHDGVSCG